MSTTETPWNAETPPPKSSNRKLWWIFGCAGAALLGCVGIGVLATILVPNVMVRLESAQRDQVEVHLSEIDAALEQYKSRHGSYPRSLADLTAPGEVFADTGLPRDPWGTGYVMLEAAEQGTRPRLLTYGRDGKPGGEFFDADIEHTPR